MKNILRTAGLLVAVSLCVFLSCKKSLFQSSSHEQDALVADAKAWYTQHDTVGDGSTEADWASAVTTTNPNGEAMVIVPESGGFKAGKTGYASSSSFVFFVDNDKITKGFLVQIVGDKQTLQTQGQNIFVKLRQYTVDGLQSGAVIVYTVTHELYQSRLVKNGVIVDGTGAAVTKAADVSLSGYTLINGVLVRKATEAPSQSGGTRRVASTMGTMGESNCTDWYLVSYDANTGEELSETYLYTSCDNSGGGSGTSTTPSTPETPPCPSSFHFVTKISGSMTTDPQYEGGWQVAGISGIDVKFVSVDGEMPNVTVTMPTLYFGLPVVKEDGSVYTNFTYEIAQGIATNAVKAAEDATNKAYLSGVSSQDALTKTFRATLTTEMAKSGGTVTPTPGTGITVPAKDMTVADYPGLFGC